MSTKDTNEQQENLDLYFIRRKLLASVASQAGTLSHATLSTCSYFTTSELFSKEQKLLEVMNELSTLLIQLDPHLKDSSPLESTAS